MFAAENRPRLFAMLLFAAFFVLYASTLQQTVATADNAEFQRVGLELGLAHPPGFPLYTLLAHGMTQLPLPLPPHVKINLLSVLTSSLTLVFVYLSSYRLSKNEIVGGLAAVALGTATTFWQQAVYANIRSMSALFAAICLWALINWWQRRAEGAGAYRFVIAFALSLGFGFTHHLSLAFMGLVMVGWLLWHDWRSWRWLPIGLLGLLPWLYLPLSSAELRTPAAFLTYALGLGFGGDFFAFATPTELLARATVMANVLTFQLHVGFLLAACVGVVRALFFNRSIATLLIASAGLHTLVTATYRAPQTVEYMLPAYVPLVIGIALAVAQVSDTKRGPITIAYSALLVLLLAMSLPPRWRSFRALATDAHAQTLAANLLRAAPEDAQILSNWHWFNTLRYVQATESIGPNTEITYVVPSGESYAENWAVLIAAGVAAEKPVVATNYWAQFMWQLPAGQPLADARIWRSAPLLMPPDTFQTTEIVLGDAIRVQGYRSPADATIGEEVVVEVAWELIDQPVAASLFLHLVGDDGQLYAQHDVSVRSVEGVNMTQFRLTPRWGAVPETYQLLVGAYLADGTPLFDSAENQRTPLATLSLSPSPWRPYTRNPINRSAENELRLIGYDFDCTLPDQPRTYHHFRTVDQRYFSRTLAGLHHPNGREVHGCGSYVPLGHGIVWLGSNATSDWAEGVALEETLKLTQRFASTRPVVHDLAVSVSLTGFAADNVSWAWQLLDDTIPAMGAIPTLKWIAGSQIRDPHWVTVSPDAVVGQPIEARMVVYDAFSNRPIAVLDERLTQLGVGIPLFRTAVKGP